MRAIRVAMLASASAVFIVRAAPAYAQQTANASNEARTTFLRGVRALEDGRYREAIEDLEHSLLLRDVPIVHYNLGLAYRGVGMNLEAIAAFERLLGQPTPRMTNAEIDSVRRTITTLRATLANVEVHATPAAVELVIDGRPTTLHEGVTPMNPGRHVFEFRAPGYAPEQREVQLATGAHESIAVHLRRIDGGHLVVVPSIPNAVVSIDGHRQTTSPIDLAASAGPHRVEVSAAGFDRFERMVTVGTSGVLRVEVRMAPAARVRWVVPAVIGAAAGVVIIGVVTGVVIGTAPRQGDLGQLPNGTLGRTFEP